MATAKNYQRQIQAKYQQKLSAFIIHDDTYLSECNIKDVISFNTDKWISIGKIKEIIQKAFSQIGIDSIRTHISNNSEFKNSHNWFLEGEECEILKAGSEGWQKGRLKINVTLEFISDEPEKTESPLDDVRQEIDSRDR